MRSWAILTLAALALSGCELDDQFPSQPLQEYFGEHPAVTQPGQARFLMDDFGTFSIRGLMVNNILPAKIYFTALLLADPSAPRQHLSGADVPRLMERFGFIRPEGIANWRDEIAPKPALPDIEGLIRSTLEFRVPKIAQAEIHVSHFKLEVRNITCAACHSGVTYDAKGFPQKQVWLGSPNSSLNIDAFFEQIYQGLKSVVSDPDHFIAKLREAYPDIDTNELQTVRALLPSIQKEMKKYAQMDRVFPFPEGGPGLTNGVAAFKRDAKLLLHPYRYDNSEAGFVSIPDISNRGFRSSLTYDGVYSVPGQARYRRVNQTEAQDPSHLDSLANLAAFFTYSAMGNSINNIEPNLPKVREVFRDFIKELKPAPFPGKINSELASRGEQVFRQNCASCHGDYTAGIDHPRLVSFPNRFVPQKNMGTDPLRWEKVDDSIEDFVDSTVFSKYVAGAKQLGGYVAPILSGIWYTAPYLHNGSVPTLWQLMNPELRPTRFQLGGHAIDFENVGIAGVMVNSTDFLYKPGYRPWMDPEIYDTRLPGHSNKGHEKPFRSLTSDEKHELIEYLKLL